MRPDSIFNKIAAKRSFGISLLGLSAVLLILVSQQLGHKLPPLPSLKSPGESAALNAPIDKIEQLSSRTAFFRVQPVTNGSHPFYTLNFKPPPPPPQATTNPPVPAVPEPPKPPPPPPTKKLAVLYQGVYQSAGGTKKAFLLVDGKLSISPLGTAVAADWAIADIGIRQLILTNRAAATNTFQFNQPATIEVPAQ